MITARTVWKSLAATLLGLVVLLAIGVGALRVWLDRSPAVAPEVMARLEKLTGLSFAFARLDARLGLRGPELVFREARITVPGQHEPLVTATAGRIGFDVWRSLRTGRVAAGRVVLEGARVYLYLTPEGVELRGQGALDVLEGDARLRLDELPVGHLQIENATVTVQDLQSGAQPWRVDRVNLDLERDPQALTLAGSVRLPAELGARLDVQARLDGDLADSGSLAWRCEVTLTGVQFAGWPKLVPHWRWLPAAGSGDLGVSVSGRGSVLGSATAQINLQRLVLADERGAPPTRLDALGGRLKLEHRGTRWSASGRELIVDPGHDAWRHGEFDFSLDWDDDGLHAASLRAPALPLGPINTLVPLLPVGTVRTAAAALAPRGALAAVDLGLARGARPTEWRIDGGARFTGLGFGPWRSVPGLTGLDGDVAANGAGGRVRVHSGGLTLALPEFLRAPVAATKLRATFDWWWQPDGWRFAIDDLQAVAADGHGGGKGRLFIPADGDSPRLVLDLMLADIDARAAPKYLPGMTIPKPAMAWLDQAFLAGKVTTAHLEYAGETRRFPFRDGGGLFRIRVPFEGMRVHYQDGFADLEEARGVAEFHNQGFSAHASSARVGGLAISDAEAGMADFAAAELSARAAARGDVRDGLAFLQASPVGPKLGTLFMKASAQGPFTAEVTLDFPFKRFAERRVDVLAHLEGVSARLPGLDDEFRDLSGSFTLRDRELEVPELRGTVLGGALRIAAHTVAGPSNVPGDRVLIIDASGRATGERLQPLLGITHGSWLQGSIDWRGQARLPRLEWRPDPDPQPADAAPEAVPVPHEVEFRFLPATIRIDSSLVGLSIGLPPPLAKNADDIRPLHADIAVDPGLLAGATPLPTAGKRREVTRPATVTARAAVGRDSGALEWRRDPEWALRRGTLRFGGGQAALRDPTGVWLEGRIQDYDLSAWLPIRLSAGASQGLGGYLRGGTLVVDHFGIFGFRFPDVTLTLEGRDQAWRATVAGPAAHGVVVVPWDLPGTMPLSIDMDELALGERATGTGTEQPTDPTQLPALSIVVRDFDIQGRHFGSLEAHVSRTEDGLQLDHAALNGASFEATARGNWALTSAGQSSVVSFSISSTDLLDTLNAWGFAPTLTAHSGHASGDLHWPGGIDGDVFGRLAGTVNIRVEHGQLMTVDPGAGRVLGLLSVAALPRRLTLDFRDLTDKGFAFDSIKGDFEFRDGNAYTNNLVLKGPAAEIGIVGRTGIKARDYDQTAKVTGHFGGPLAAAGALAAGPAVGAALLLFSTVFKEPLGGIARGYYRITGGWEKPHIERIGAGAAREAAGTATAGDGGH
jgi:uncharacterized protein (TIGR02099 family)